MNEELGKLKPVDLREIWRYESQDFTPWLAVKSNLSILGEALGLDLDPVDTEYAVGRYSADVVCNITGDSDALVVIENQLAESDHGHLGQTLTYTAELEPVAAVWIASSFTVEHKKSIDWLNEIASDRTQFFAVTVDVWQIGDSLKAPRFSVVAHPSNWNPQTNRGRSNRGPTKLTPLKQQQKAFWTALMGHLVEANSALSLPTPQPLNEAVFATGRSYFQFRAVTDKWNQEIVVSLYIRGPQAKDHYERLLAQERRDRTRVRSRIGMVHRDRR